MVAFILIKAYTFSERSSYFFDQKMIRRMFLHDVSRASTVANPQSVLAGTDVAIFCIVQKCLL